MKYYMSVKNPRTGKVETLHCASALLRGLEAIHRSDSEILRQWETADDVPVPVDLRREDLPNSGKA